MGVISPHSQSSSVEAVDAESEDEDDEIDMIIAYSNKPLTATLEFKDLKKQVSQEVVFHKFDSHKSGEICRDQFTKMLPELNIYISTAKAAKIFTALIPTEKTSMNIDEFRAAIFALDPIKGNSSGLRPRNCLSPQDVFEFFDLDRSETMDDMEFADVLEFCGINVSDATKIDIFNRYDKNKKGYITSLEFRAMWLKLCDVKQELGVRGASFVDGVSEKKLRLQLSQIVQQEETAQEQAIQEAKQHYQQEQEQSHHRWLEHVSKTKANNELAVALDTAGQVYIFGTGRFGQFSCQGPLVDRDESDFKSVKSLWKNRFDPQEHVHRQLTKRPLNTVLSVSQDSVLSQTPILSSEDVQRQSDTPKSAFVRQKPENERFRYQSPPKLTKQSLMELKRYKRNLIAVGNSSNSLEVNDNEVRSSVHSRGSQSNFIAGTSHCDTNETEFEDIHYDRFRNVSAMANTECLWGRGIVSGGLGDHFAIAITEAGFMYSWGGKPAAWNPTTTNQDDSDDSLQSDESPRQYQSADEEHCDNQKNDPDELSYQRAKLVLQYYNLWTPAPTYSVRRWYQEGILLPKLSQSDIKRSLALRGIEISDRNLMGWIDALSECLTIENENGRPNSEWPSYKAWEEHIVKENNVSRNSVESLKMKRSWEPLRTQRTAMAQKLEETREDREMQEMMQKEEAYRRRLKAQQDREASPYRLAMDNTLIAGGEHADLAPQSVAIACVAIGDANTMAISHTNSAFAWKMDVYEPRDWQSRMESGTAPLNQRPMLLKGPLDIPIQSISCSAMEVAAVSTTNILYNWQQRPSQKQFLDPAKNQDHLNPNFLSTLPSVFHAIQHVSCGVAHSGATTVHGELYMWGCADGGRLGLGVSVQGIIANPVRVDSFIQSNIRIALVACGATHSVATTAIESAGKDTRIGSKADCYIGGYLYTCGSPIPLGEYRLSWQLLPTYPDHAPIKQISCGYAHSAAVSVHGELYTWGKNDHGCTGHASQRSFIQNPELLECFHVEPSNVTNPYRTCRQSSVYNQQGPELAVDPKSRQCAQTQMEEMPWWEIDLGLTHLIHRIHAWRPSTKNTNVAESYQVPLHIFVSEKALYSSMNGEAGLTVAKSQANVWKCFECTSRLTEWILSETEVRGRYIRIQAGALCSLQLEQVQIFGSLISAPRYNKVNSAYCSHSATLVIIPPVREQSILERLYRLAVKANVDNAKILRELGPYQSTHAKENHNVGYYIAVSIFTCYTLLINSAGAVTIHRAWEYRTATSIFFLHLDTYTISTNPIPQKPIPHHDWTVFIFPHGGTFTLSPHCTFNDSMYESAQSSLTPKKGMMTRAKSKAACCETFIPSSQRKQRSLHDFFTRSKIKVQRQRQQRKTVKAAKPPRHSEGNVQKQIRYDTSSEENPEPDIEPRSSQPLRRRIRKSYTSPVTSVTIPATSIIRQNSQCDEVDYLTPQDQPVVHLSHPTTPSPLKNRQRRDYSSIDIEKNENIAALATTPKATIDNLVPETPIEAIKMKTQSFDFMNPFISPSTYTNLKIGKRRRTREQRQSLPLSFEDISAKPLSRYLCDFIEQELMGSGSSSKVYKCIKKIDGWTYAIKKSKRHFRGKADRERSLREVQALAALYESPHIVRYFDAWIEDDLLYIQLEFCQACSLEYFLNQAHAQSLPFIPESTLCKVLCHIARALYDMHRKRMVHLDVKIQNLLVRLPQEIYKLGDLGSVAHQDGKREVTEGDNRYLSRELVEGNLLHLKSADIFALGASIYELALGRHLASCGQEWQRIRNGDLVMFRQYSNSFQHLIANMMHPDPLQRPLAQEILQHEVIKPFCTYEF